MSRLEVRVSEACKEAADTVRPETVRGLDLSDGRRSASIQRATATRKHGRVLGPLAAASAVAVIAAGAVVVPRLVGVAPAHHARTRHMSAHKPNVLAELPKFMVLNNTNVIDVVATATGRVVGRLRAPARQGFVTLAGTTGDRTFFVAAGLNPQTACRSFFYRFRLSADGKPSALTPLPVGRLIGLPSAVATNGTGSLVGFSMVKCASAIAGPIGSGRVIGGIGLIDPAADKITKVWSYTLGDDYATDLTMSADGRLLGYSTYLANNHEVGRALPTSSPSGTDVRYSRIVVREPNLATALSPSGLLMYAVSGSRRQVLAAYDTANGQLVRVLHRWPASTTLARAVIDPAGGYLLVPFTRITHRKLKLYPISYRFRHPCAPVRVHNTVKCEQYVPPVTHFLSVNLTTGAVTTLPFTDTGSLSWGMVAW